MNEYTTTEAYELALSMQTELTTSEAYELALIWMPRINKNLATEWELLNLASKIYTGSITLEHLATIAL